MTFAHFIKKNYSPEEQEEIKFILREFLIYDAIESSLNDFYQATDSKNKSEIISQLVLTCREFVMIIYEPLYANQFSKQKETMGDKLTTFVNYLISDTYQLSGLKPFEYFELLKQTIRKTCSKHSWDVTILEKWLKADNVNVFSREMKDACIPKFSKPIKLSWQGEKHLDLFVDDLAKSFKGVKGKKQVYHLFDEVKADFKIDLPSKYLLTFLILFNDLHEYGTIKVVGNRGLFVYLHQHLQAPPKDKYPKRDFRKLRHEAEQNEKVKNNITRIIKPLLDKYCDHRHSDDGRTKA